VTIVRSGTRLWILAFVGFNLLFAGWAVAAPYNGPPDEQPHVLRAAAVTSGDLFPADGYLQEVPASLVRERCFPMRADVAADCSAEPGGDETIGLHKTPAAYYNPIYYWVTAWPVAVWPDWTGILLARLLNGAAMSALLASAVVAASRWTRHGAVLAGLVVGVTPMVAHLGGAVNPNGLEIAAAVALFTGLIALLLEKGTELNRGAVALTGVSASVLVIPRSLGVMWLGVIVGVVLLGASRARLRELVRERVVRGWLGMVVAAGVVCGIWTLIARPQRLWHVGTDLTAGQIAKGAFLDMWPNMPNQMVGVMGWAETLQPRLVYLAWFIAVGFLVLGGYVLGGRLERWRMIALFLATFVPLIAAELVLVETLGWFNQGRYFLPGAVGLPMLGAHVMARHGVTATQFRTVIRMLVVGLLPFQLICLSYTMTRWQSGGAILNPLEGSWMPPLGPVVPLVVGAAAVLVLGVMFWRAAGGSPELDAPAAEQRPRTFDDGVPASAH
jgi:hypothetical protein